MTEKLAPDVRRLVELLETVADENYVLGPQDRDDLVFLLGVAVDEARAKELTRAKALAASVLDSPTSSTAGRGR